MTEFPNILFKKCVDPVAKVDWFEVAEDCQCRCIGQIIIPKGYRTDFASVPRFLWPVFPPHGRMANAATLHDYMYDNRINENRLGEYKAREYADDVFAQGCLKDGVPFWQVTLIYYIIRAFGRTWWTK